MKQLEEMRPQGVRKKKIVFSLIGLAVILAVVLRVKYGTRTKLKHSSETSLTRAIDSEREAVKQELATFQPEDGRLWTDLLMEEGGRPRQVLVVTTWRSGSTFIGRSLC